MLTDRQGNALSGATPDAVDAYDRAVEAFNLYRGDPVGTVDKAIAAAPDLVMAHALKAWFFALATEPEAAREAARILGRAHGLARDERETSHLYAISLILDGEWTKAATALDWHSIRWPHDIVALQAGHLIDFFRANARDLRDRIARALPQWDDKRPGYSALLGMHAFGLEECGNYAGAEARGREALDRQPLDGWAHHAVAHVMEMQGRPEDGLEWMNTRQPHWAGDGAYFQVHNWWHKGLYHLELGQHAAALALYDEKVDALGGGLAVNLVDSSSLLWRIHLEGIDVGGRWNDLADAWSVHDPDGGLSPFNDFHAAMAWLGADRIADVDRLIAIYRETEPKTEINRWARDTGLPLIEGIAAFWRGDYEKAAGALHGARYVANSFGGSHAQRDVIDWTMQEAAIRGGMHSAAEAFAGERLALKPHSPLNRQFLERARHAGQAEKEARLSHVRGS